MHATTVAVAVAVDFAKSSFQIAVANEHWHTIETQRLTRTSRINALRGFCRWALEVQGRSNHNKATCALANKLARICYATLRDHAPFDEAARLNKKQSRQSFALPA